MKKYISSIALSACLLTPTLSNAGLLELISATNTSTRNATLCQLGSVVYNVHSRSSEQKDRVTPMQQIAAAFQKLYESFRDGQQDVVFGVLPPEPIFPGDDPDMEFATPEAREAFLNSPEPFEAYGAAHATWYSHPVHSRNTLKSQIDSYRIRRPCPLPIIDQTAGPENDGIIEQFLENLKRNGETEFKQWLMTTYYPGQEFAPEPAPVAPRAIEAAAAEPAPTPVVVVAPVRPNWHITERNRELLTTINTAIDRTIRREAALIEAGQIGEQETIQLYGTLLFPAHASNIEQAFAQIFGARFRTIADKITNHRSLKTMILGFTSQDDALAKTAISAFQQAESKAGYDAGYQSALRALSLIQNIHDELEQVDNGPQLREQLRDSVIAPMILQFSDQIDQIELRGQMRELFRCVNGFQGRTFLVMHSLLKYLCENHQA